MKKTKCYIKPSLSRSWHVFAKGRVKADLRKVKNVFTLISLKTENCCCSSSERPTFKQIDTSTSLKVLGLNQLLKTHYGSKHSALKLPKLKNFLNSWHFTDIAFSGDPVCSPWGVSHRGKPPEDGRRSVFTRTSREGPENVGDCPFKRHFLRQKRLWFRV